MQYTREQFRAWGALGGPRRKLNKAQRSKIAKKAAKARWHKAKRNGA